MTFIACKAGVKFAGFTPALVRILVALARLSDRYIVMITSGSDGAHMETSRHYVMEAVDLRTKHYTEAQLAGFMAALRAELGPAFTVLLEGEGTENQHLHLQPVKGSTYTLQQLRDVCGAG